MKRLKREVLWWAITLKACWKEAWRKTYGKEIDR